MLTEKSEHGDVLKRNYVKLTDVVLENGGSFPEITLAYHTFGTLNEKKSNIVLIYHALSGDAHVARTPNLPKGETSSPPRAIPYTGPPWWEGIVGDNLSVDTRRWFVVCFNTLGSCYGTTGPLVYANTTTPFPYVTIKDQVDVTVLAMRKLGFGSVHATIGASLGGMQVLETALRYPTFSKKYWMCAVGDKATSSQIGFQSLQVEAIKKDPEYLNGAYNYKTGQPKQGLSLARKIAHLTYRNGEGLNVRFANSTQKTHHGTTQRKTLPPGELTHNTEAVNTPLSEFAIESYLNHQALKFVKRFDANTYITLTEALNSHDVFRAATVNVAGENINPIELSKKHIPNESCMVVSLEGDQLQPLSSQQKVVELLTESKIFTPQKVNSGTDSATNSSTENSTACKNLRTLMSEKKITVRNDGIVVVQTSNGHDGFLTETNTIGATLECLLNT